MVVSDFALFSTATCPQSDIVVILISLVHFLTERWYGK